MRIKNDMRFLVIGSGGREHALVWKLKQSSHVREVLCAPGNGGIEKDARCLPISLTDQNAVLEAIRRERIDLVVIGPEAPLAAGLADTLRAQGIAVLGPGKLAARLESSKIFAKEFMERHGIPTAGFSVHSNAADALARLDSSEICYPVVIKADGLAAGKGVVIANNADEARQAISRMMVEREFGIAGERILIEEFLQGSEASFIVFTDGKSILPAVAAQDHKAAYDHDRGPNTGGMGAYSTDRILSPEIRELVLAQVIRPVVEGMNAEGSPFQGILYAGLMLTSKGPKVLEFNVRMGDPEGQVILPRLASDFSELCLALCEGRLGDIRPVWTERAAICVVLASEGYPGAYPKGKSISGLEMAAENPSIQIFHSGTRRQGNMIVTDGGRVLGITALGEDLPSAIMSVYEAINKIHFDGMHYRRDIGAKGIQ
jgi:phosphoribosylamine--glycine ligase